MHSLLRGEQNVVTEILARLEVESVELREQVFPAELLNQMDSPMREMLSRGLVFELPVPREAVIAVCRGGFGDKFGGNTDKCDTKPALNHLHEYINRAVALGLLEVSPDTSLRVPRILPLKLPEDAETLHKQATEVLYRLWLEQTKTITVFHLQEARQLALQGNEESLAEEIHMKWIEYYKALPSYGRLDFTNPLNSMYVDF